MLHYEFTCKTGGERTDKFLALQDTGITRSAAAALIEQGCCLVNGKIAAKNQKLKTGDTVTLDVPEAQPADILPENIPLDIVYEDGDLLVVNKPKGMVVHPAPGHYSGTLVNALMYHCGDSLSGINGVIRPGIVHRIDRDTSGLLIVAKNDTAHNILAEQIKVHSFTREYMGGRSGRYKRGRDGRCADRQTQDRPQEDVRYDREFKRGGNPLFCRADIQEQYACKASS